MVEESSKLYVLPFYPDLKKMADEGSKSKEYISESDDDDQDAEKPLGTAGQTDTAGTSALSDAGVSGAEGSANGEGEGTNGEEASGMEVDA